MYVCVCVCGWDGGVGWGGGDTNGYDYFFNRDLGRHSAMVKRVEH